MTHYPICFQRHNIALGNIQSTSSCNLSTPFPFLEYNLQRILRNCNPSARPGLHVHSFLELFSPIKVRFTVLKLGSSVQLSMMFLIHRSVGRVHRLQRLQRHEISSTAAPSPVRSRLSRKVRDCPILLCAPWSQAQPVVQDVHPASLNPVR